ncbi:MAG: 50S ribosomal protein L28 [Candidatus Omnitrophica bacterium]|nr:50S ribosomal protein L28 [Candidatus Omnitrophota bacterium]
MSKRCDICGKKAITGTSIARRGLPKKKGGVGLKTTGITKRKFYPNLQPRKVVVHGKIKKALVCTRCIKSGKITLPLKKTSSDN